MFPEEFRKRIVTQKYIDSRALLKALEEPSPVSIRINPSKWNHKPVRSNPVPWCTAGHFLETRPSYTLDPLFHAGCYYPQEASSMFIEQTVRQHVNASEPIKVLDLCGAPGGKSTHLSTLIGNDSMLIANDVIRSRASILSETLTKWGAGNAIVTQSDPSAFGSLEGFFDVILVDAPCSGEGMFRTEIARSEWSEANTAHCSERQKRILLDTWPALKENGLLIYSTCTFNPSENEENIEWLTEKHKAESLTLDISGFKGIQEIDFHGIKGYGFYPDRIAGEGFFISVLRKREAGKQAKLRTRVAGELRPSRREADSAKGWIAGSSESLLKWGDDIWQLPCDLDDYVQLFQNLKILKAGTKLATVKKNDFLPAHDLALSSLSVNAPFPCEELNYEDAVAFLRKDNIKAKLNVRGWNIVSYRRVNLGFVNNLGTRLNNYFPVEWRIRMNVPVNCERDLIQWE